MPLQRRLPKVGFNSRKTAMTGEVRLDELAKVNQEVVDLQALYKADLLPRSIARAKVILSGKLEKAITIKGLRATKGARAAIEAAGGKVED